MRPQQKSGRSRGNKNRNKGGGGGGMGHSPNRVYESAGPEGKVRGTPQQIIDKYLALARDSQLSGDRVTAENFLQHAEHYSRILIAAQEAMGIERRDQQQPQGGYFDRNDSDDDSQDDGDPRDARDARDPRDQRDQRDQRGGEQRNGSGGFGGERRDRPQPQPQPAEASESETQLPRFVTEPARPAPAPEPVEAAPQAAAPQPAASSESFATIEPDGGAPDIVETPESRAAPAERPRRPRRPRRPAAEGETAAEPAE